MIEEKKQREHLLHLNQILAKQVMEMSKIVAGKILFTTCKMHGHTFHFTRLVFYCFFFLFCFVIFIFIGTNSADEKL